MRTTLLACGSLAAPMLAAMCLASCDSGSGTPQPQPAKPEPAPAQADAGRADGAALTFSVYALSRGSGVPPAAREAQRKIQDLLEADRARGVDVDVRAIRLGLEGEQKLCVTYVDAKEAARTIERVRAMARGIDLVNVVVEPCSSAKEKP